MIIQKIEKEKVADVYDDLWSEGLVRVQFLNEGRKEKVFGKETLEKRMSRRGWLIEEVAMANSGTRVVIVNRKEYRICDSCGSSPLYDSQESKWYCPICSR